MSLAPGICALGSADCILGSSSRVPGANMLKVLPGISTAQRQVYIAMLLKAPVTGN